MQRCERHRFASRLACCARLLMVVDEFTTVSSDKIWTRNQTLAFHSSAPTQNENFLKEDPKSWNFGLFTAYVGPDFRGIKTPPLGQNSRSKIWDIKLRYIAEQPTPHIKSPKKPRKRQNIAANSYVMNIHMQSKCTPLLDSFTYWLFTYVWSLSSA